MKIRDSRSGVKRSHSMGEAASQIYDTDAEVAVATLYEKYRGDFIRFAAKTFHLGRDEAAEIYQESFIAMHQNIRNGRLKNLTSALKSYLFEIGKHKMMNRSRDKRIDRIQPINDNILSIIDYHSDGTEWHRKQELTNRVVEQMKEPCLTILKLYYWERKSMSDIARAMQYKNGDVVKNRKSLCLKKIKEELLRVFNSEGLTI